MDVLYKVVQFSLPANQNTKQEPCFPFTCGTHVCTALYEIAALHSAPILKDTLHLWRYFEVHNFPKYRYQYHMIHVERLCNTSLLCFMPARKYYKKYVVNKESSRQTSECYVKDSKVWCHYVSATILMIFHSHHYMGNCKIVSPLTIYSFCRKRWRKSVKTVQLSRIIMFVSLLLGSSKLQPGITRSLNRSYHV